MNRFQKSIGVSLAALMVAAAGMPIYAKNYDDVKEDHAAKTEISILSDIGVIKGTSEGEFSPEDNVTREQMATLLFRLMLGRDDAGRTNTTSFKDLYEPYYNGAISWAYAAGYILGTSKTTFEPRGGITKQDAMAMLVRALGQESDNMNKGYPWSYINAGIKLGLDRGLEKVGYEETLTRAETAVILYNALTSEYLVDRTTSGGNVYFESTSIIEEVFGYSMAEATLIATNDYTVTDNTVIKSGYVTLLAQQDEESFIMTVPFAQMNLAGKANDHVGMSFRVIYSEANGKHTVLSAVPTSTATHYDTVEIDEDSQTVKIGDNRYTLVSEYSDELTTNNNELKLYAYDEDGKLEQIEDLEELSALLGFYRVTLIHDNGNENAKRALIRVFEMDQLIVAEDGKINVAGNKKAEALNLINSGEAKNGDFVLYYYNEKTAELELAEVLSVVSGTVRRITANTVKIGDNTYGLGNEVAGISASSIRNKLALGGQINAVVHKNAVVAIVEGVTISDASRYLIALDDAHRVYEDGSFRYVLTAFIDGEEKNVYVKNADARQGQVYRYTEAGGVYSLIAPTVEDGIILSGKTQFIQNADGIHEIAHIIQSANGTTIELGGRNYYTLNRGSAESVSSVAGLQDVRFVCDNDTVIVVNDNGTLHSRTGAYTSTIQVNDGAQIVAIFDNEVGSVESLKYLYISDGSLGNYDLDASFVRILAQNGLVYENEKAYVEYIVYSFASGKIETMLSAHGELTVGADYRCGADDTITDQRADLVMDGFVSGYTASTVSIDGTAYTLGKTFRAIRITADNKVEEMKVSDLYMKNVEFIADRGEITLIIEGEEPTFTTVATAESITVTPDFDLSNVADAALTGVKLESGNTQIDLAGATIERGEGNTIVVRMGEGVTLANGEYKLTFALGGRSFTVAANVAVESEPQQPEQGEPEQGQPEQGQPEDNEGQE